MPESDIAARYKTGAKLRYIGRMCGARRPQRGSRGRVRNSYDRCCYLIAMLVFISVGGEARAWGDLGHKVICEIAFRLVQPDTRVAINRLMQLDSQFKTFSDSCIYPDHPRIRAAEHFLNLPRDSKGLRSDECPLADACVLTAILHDFKILQAKDQTDANRLVALKSLGHWVGDIHQPLHVSFVDDRGGITIRTSGQCPGNLHAVWDNCLVLYAVGPDVSEAATDLLASITSELKAQWNASVPRDWANESFAIAEATRTMYCNMHGPSCDMTTSDLNITAEYLDANEPVVKQQLQKAGVRLAWLLDSAFLN